MSTPTAPLPPSAAAAAFRQAASRAASLGNEALSPRMPDLAADDLAHAEDLMAGMQAQLEQAGRLDLIGGAA